jgi:hypothetical protein
MLPAVPDNQRMEAKYKDSLTSPKVPAFEWQDPQDDGDRQMFRDILTDGCHIITVYPDGTTPEQSFDFAYSVGFYLNLLHPEFLIMGISSDSAGRVMNDLFAYIESGAKIAENHTLRYDLGKGEKRLVAKLVPQERYFDYLGHACWFYRSLLWKVEPLAEHKFPVLQLFWPDAAGLYPWDPGCDSRVKEIQTLVEQPESDGS